MKLALKLEFPDEQAPTVLRLLQSMPNATARVIPHPTSSPSRTNSDAELEKLFQQLAGSWQSDENSEKLARQIQEARHFRDREVEL